MKGIEAVREMIKTQAGDGNWNFDAYQHGMYNGLELALATIEGRDPELKFAVEPLAAGVCQDKPEERLRDKIMEESDPPPETEEPEITYWDQDGVEFLQWENEDEAIENILDGTTDGELEICGYTRRKIKGLTEDAEYIAEKLIDYWDEEYGSDQDYTEPTQEMIALAYDFVRKMSKQYEVWQCEIVCRKKINVKQWVSTHRPDWLTTSNPQREG